MKPHKHPPIFVKILAITFAFWIISGVAGQAFLAFFTPGPLSEAYWEFTKLQWQWLLSELFGIKPRYEGVEPENFVERDFGWWTALARNLYRQIDYLGELAIRGELYYIRRAELEASKYVGNQQPPEDKIMAPIANELCKIQRGVVVNIEGLIQQARDMDDSWTGDLSGYHVFISYEDEYDQYHYLTIHAPYEIVYVATGEGVVWNCNGWNMEEAQPGRAYPLYKYLVIAPGHVAIQVSGHEANAIGILSYDSNGPMSGYEFQTPFILSVISFHYFDSPADDKYELYPALYHFVTKTQKIYSDAWDFAKVYHECLRGMGYTDPNQIPKNMLPPPVDAAYYPLDKLQQQSVPLEEIMLSYSAWLERVTKLLSNESMVSSCAGIGKPALTTTVVTTEETIITESTTVVTSTYTTVINGTTTTMTTTYTTTVNGTTVITTTRTLYVVYTPDNVYVVDFTTKLLNVTVCLPSGTCFDAAEIALIDILEPITFNKGQTTTLNSPVRAFVNFGNGTITVMDLPAGTQITPQAIVTKSKDGEFQKEN